ncbi:MAG: SEC-C metal-binding domain-containing protein, partial [Eubacterium sp.]|nr:SEC-C metal-binding domain-containing protein [Eubacterium sp.]
AGQFDLFASLMGGPDDAEGSPFGNGPVFSSDVPNLPEWDNIFTAEKRAEITKAYKRSKTVVNENKVGRNDPCPCGSGKKYKKCCGR